MRKEGGTKLNLRLLQVERSASGGFGGKSICRGRNYLKQGSLSKHEGYWDSWSRMNLQF